MKKTYDSKFKSRVALEAMRGELTIAEIASKYQIHPNQVQRWIQLFVAFLGVCFTPVGWILLRCWFLLRTGAKRPTISQILRMSIPEHVDFRQYQP